MAKEQPEVCSKEGKVLAALLKKSKVDPEPKPWSPTTEVARPGFNLCRSEDCRLCQGRAVDGPDLHFSHNERTVTVKKSFCCTSSSIVYLVTCLK